MTDPRTWAAEHAGTVGGPVARAQAPAEPAGPTLTSRFAMSLEPARVDDPTRSVCFIPGTSDVLGAGNDVFVVDTRTGRSRISMAGNRRVSNHVAVVKVDDKPMVAIGGSDNAVQLRGLTADDTSVRIRKLVGHVGAVWGVAFSPDGELLASAGGDRVTNLWSTRSEESRTPVRSLVGHDGGVTCVAFDANGRLLFSGGADCSARVWDVRTGREVHRLTGHGGIVWSMSFDPNRNLLATSDAMGRVLLWDVGTAELIREWRHHHRGITPIAFSPSGDLLAMPGPGSTIRLCEPHTGRVWEFEQRSRRLASLAFGADVDGS
ncbi:WD40 repeat domain-containing protein, partial [Saccharothrix sp. MB29]|nr:WD40 repeat domain-containing protein [Saccharothrix sp. MB29]